MSGFLAGSFPLLRRWPRWPDSDDACHLYLRDSITGICGRRSGNGTSSAAEMSCPACWWRLVRVWWAAFWGLP